jgi:hypothetical protein
MATLGAAVALLLVGMWQTVRAWQLLNGRRRTADRLLLWGAEPRPSSELLAWRAAELISTSSRKTLARSLRRLAREAEGRVLPGAVPVNRRGIRSQLGLLRALEAHLADLDQPVSPRGVLLVEQLLTEPGSPLYSYGQDDQLAQLLSEACAALAPLPEGVVMDFSLPVSARAGADRHTTRLDRTAWTGGR